MPTGMDDASLFRDLRERAVALLRAGKTIRSSAAALSIAASCVSKWKRRFGETSSLGPGRVGGRKQRTLSGERAERGIKTDGRAVWVFVRAEGLSFKNGSAG